jgi:hypothetical protein
VFNDTVTRCCGSSSAHQELNFCGLEIQDDLSLISGEPTQLPKELAGEQPPKDSDD